MPEWRAEVLPRLAALQLSPAREAEIIEELASHLDERYEELRRAGTPEEEARRLAIDELCERDALARHMRPLRQSHVTPPVTPGAHRGALLTDLWQDIRYAVRMLRKHPGFTAAVVITLALGIGANTAIFSIVNATLLTRLPVATPEELVYVTRGNRGVFPYPGYAALRDGNHVMTGLAAWGGIGASLNAGTNAELVGGCIVTGNFFDVLGIKPALGRLISPADDVTPGAHPVAVIGYDYWRSRFGGTPGIVGQQVRLNGHLFTIIGVTPAGFPGPRLGEARSIYVPMMMQAVMRPPRARYSGEQNPDLLTHKTNSWLFGIGRLAPGVTATQARAELSTLFNTYMETVLKEPLNPPQTVTLTGVNDGDPDVRRQMVSVALLLGGVVGAVLLIGCANIANLLLARATARRRELAVRLAIGASRVRIVRQLLTESLLLSLIGGAAGVALAWGAIEVFRAMPPPDGALPQVDLAVDVRVLLFSLALSLITGIIFGLIPALRASRPDVVPALKDAVEDPASGRRFALKQVLVVSEVALSLVLLVAAGLFVRSLQIAQRIDTGFDAERLVSAPLNVNLLRYTTTQGREFYRRTLERVERLPGVESASLARVAVLTSGARVVSIHVEGRPSSHGSMQAEGTNPTSDSNAINANVIGGRFFKTLGIPLLLGRDFSEADADKQPLVTVVNDAAARLHFPGENPIGKRVSFDGPNGPWREIVGVVRNSKYGDLGEPDLAIAYLPLAQNHETGMTLYVRASVPPESLIPAIRRELQAIEPNLPVPDLRTVADTIGISLYAPRMGAWLLGVFGGLAMLLAAVGIYGVLSFATARRTHEIGIRLALGAETRDVFLLVIRDGMLLVALGVALGLISALAGSRSLASFLYGAGTTDPATFGVTTLLLIAVALGACAIPARRAMRVAPIVALRQE